MVLDPLGAQTQMPVPPVLLVEIRDPTVLQRVPEVAVVVVVLLVVFVPVVVELVLLLLVVLALGLSLHHPLVEL